MTSGKDERDPELPGRLLTTERDALIPLLRARPDEDFELLTAACPAWTVRDVLAHCGAALTRVVEGRFEAGVFSPESNDRDIAERADWSVPRVIDEVEVAMGEGASVIVKAGGRFDGIALGEWVHAGDVRDAFGEPDAYAGPALPDALSLLARLTRERGHRPLQAALDDADEPLLLGDVSGLQQPARFVGDAATLVRLYAGRPLLGARYELTGAKEAELNLFG